ncbi:RAMP superfamily CRISPR-associated protein [Marinilongibacter aquaticus]|uniref:RAMP superfamily CRISPR-associated protein n=1 Tax=Marinilongibacter aquaticus TaxID=2975157 RepID=UPI0021BDA259|nr:RAMP superfamily CRISPR-associated protein [Marinilongibacter aquaticus]UBM60776.1 RAMP superfamily CRISPR-associated protein [Marinilongibacter aquaticus]
MRKGDKSTMKYKYRYIARFLIEAKTPLAIGTDSLMLEQDNPVQRDFNGLPFIPSTGITGFLRQKLSGSTLFGDEPDREIPVGNEEIQAKGSHVIVSDAFLFDGERVYQTLDTSKLEEVFRHKYENLPIRPHVAIDHRGAAIDGRLYDQEVVYKGSRFKFELLLELEEENDKEWKDILNAFHDNDFYLGSGQYDGLGEIKVIECQERKYVLPKDLDAWLDLSVDLNFPIPESNSYSGVKKNKEDEPEYAFESKKYELSAADSFIHLGSGYGDYETDDANYQEEFICWDEEKKPIWKNAIVVPGTSIKGALAHRMAFYVNKSNGITIEGILEGAEEQLVNEKLTSLGLNDFVPGDTIEELEKQKETLEKQLEEVKAMSFDLDNLYEDFVTRENEDLANVFGKAKKGEEDQGKTGKVIIKDIWIKEGDYQELLFMHNKIDRYTGGTVDTEGALFSEKAFTFDSAQLEIKGDINVLENENFKKALADLLNGRLPIGGKVSRGHGILTGKEIA